MSVRLLWSFGKIIFRLSPRACFGFRRTILRLYGARIGKSVNIYSSSLVYFPWNLEVLDNAAIGEWALIYNLGIVRLGLRSTISQRVHICAGTHDYSRPEMPLLKPPVNIENDVWICADAFIGPGVTVGQFAIVAARAVVVKSVEEHTIVAGNPAKKIKDRPKFDPN